MLTSPKRRGVAAVEAALVLPLLILLLFGIAEVGWYVHMAQVLHNASRQGARAAARLENSNAEVRAAVVNCLTKAVEVDPAAVNVQMTCLSWTGEEMYQVNNLDENEQGYPISVQVSVACSEVKSPTNLLSLQGKTLNSFVVMQRKK